MRDDRPIMENDKESSLAELCTKTLALIGEDPHREGLLKTPLRVAKSLSFLTCGYQANPQEVITSALFENEARDNEGAPMMICVRDIELFSMCEHHMLPFFGRVHIAYFPKNSIIGLSKLPRLVEVFSRRLQVQERLTRDIMCALDRGLHPQGVAVAIEATHLCMRMRGVQSENAETMTLSTCGLFDQAEHRATFLDYLKR